MNKKDLLLLAFIVYFMIVGYFYLTLQGVIAETLLTIAPLIAVIGGICAIKAYGSGNPHGRALIYLTAGMASWFVAESLWSIFKYVLYIDPFPSVADFFYLAAYPLLFIGIIKEITIGRIEWNNQRKLIFGFVFVLALLVFLYFGAYLAYDAANPPVENAIKIAYNLGDFFLILGAVLILMLAMEYQGGKLFTSWWCFLIGIVLMFLADILFAIFTEEYEAMVWIFYQLDLLYILSYLFIAYAFFNMYFIVKTAEETVLQKIKMQKKAKKRK